MDRIKSGVVFYLLSVTYFDQEEIQLRKKFPYFIPSG